MRVCVGDRTKDKWGVCAREKRNEEIKKESVEKETKKKKATEKNELNFFIKIVT